MISTEIIADSRGPAGRITTFKLVYPRFIHSELMTHRALSRNAASSRAIPIRRMIRDVLKSPAMPVSWGQNGKGMQSKKELPRSRRATAALLWVLASWFACGFAWLLSRFGVHKQLANRLLEPFAHMTTLVTATEMENFFGLRAHKDAQPEFQDLAFAMLEAYLSSTPKELKAGEWHLPFGDKYVDLPCGEFHEDVRSLTTEEALKVSTARAARVSYLNFEGDIAFHKDFKLHDDLLASGHMSPFEHAARAEAEPVRSGNLIGFTQYRKLFPGEVRRLTRADMERILREKKGEK